MSLLSALLLWLAYFPANWGWLAWVALVPWLVALRDGTGRIYWASGIAGSVFGLLALQWLRWADPLMNLAWIGLALFLGLHWWLFALVVRQGVAIARWPLPLVAPVVWVSLEWVRANLDIGFAWYFLAHTQQEWLPNLGWVPVTGAYGISALVMLSNAVLAEAIWRGHVLATECRNSQRPVRSLLRDQMVSLFWLVALVLLVLTNPLLARYWRAAFTQQGSLRVVIVQPNEPQEVRNAPSEERQQRTWTQFAELVRRVGQLVRTPGPCDLVIWPETSMPFDWVRVVEKGVGDSVSATDPDEARQGHTDTASAAGAAPSSPSSAGKPSLPPGDNEGSRLTEARQLQQLADTFVHDLARLMPTWLLIGVNTRLYLTDIDSPPGHHQDARLPFRVVRYNSALLIDPKGEAFARYDKIYRIPFGEYLPLVNWFPWLAWFSPYEYEYSIEPGEGPRPIALGETGRRFGVLICYEDTVPHLPRQFFYPGPPPDFFVNISNDGWFKGSEEHEQHLAIARFRAAETRRGLVRSVNMGVSAVIDGDGTVLALPASSWREAKAREAVFVAEVPIYQGETIYVRWGDWFAWLCLALSLGLLVLMLSLRVLRRQSIAAGSG